MDENSQGEADNTQTLVEFIELLSSIDSDPGKVEMNSARMVDADGSIINFWTVLL